jgi:two-component system sensor histidine kinase KdpD
VALDEVIGAALLSVPGARTRSRSTCRRTSRSSGRPGLLERVLANLLENAIRHGGGGPVEVVARTGELDAHVKVVDHGPGVPAAHASAVRAVRASGRRHTAGRGLGLTVARGFAEAMDGVLIADGSDGAA